MSAAQTTETFNCSPQQFYDIITDYSKYPEFLNEVTNCEIVEDRGAKKLVEYSVYMIKTFKYRLLMDESQGPNKLSWSLDSGDLFKMSDGFWLIEDAGGKARATYSVEAKFKVFVPGPVSKALVNVNMPNMMSNYHKRVSAIYGN